ncbi:hypothetical protein KA013_02075 [Patescibacteria group bacterium]|nr:hypothetical protein [Patescibacteria group bacterium]
MKKIIFVIAFLAVITNTFGQSSDASGADNCTSCVVVCAIVVFLVSFMSLFAVRGAQRLKAKKEILQNYENRKKGIDTLKYATLLCAVVTTVGVLFVFHETINLLSILVTSIFGGALGLLLGSRIQIKGTIDPKAN